MKVLTTDFMPTGATPKSQCELILLNPNWRKSPSMYTVVLPFDYRKGIIPC